MLSVLHPFWFPHNRHLKGLVDWSACLCSVRRAGLEVCIHHKVLKVTELYLQSSCLVVPSERETLFQGPWSPPTCLSQACTYMLASPVLVFWGERDGKCTQLWFGTSQRHFPGAIDYQRIILQIHLLLNNYTESSGGCSLQVLPSSSNVTEWQMGLVLWRGAEFADPEYTTLGYWLFQAG